MTAKLGLSRTDSDSSAIAKLIASADEEVSSAYQQIDTDWLNQVQDQATSGKISEDEKRLLSLYKEKETRLALSGDEKRLLEKWKKRN